MGEPVGVASEVGRLRTVLLHRPGAELRRLTPRTNDQLLFDGLPWVDRAQDEHDAFAALLRDRGVEVLLVDQLLAEALEDPAARRRAVADLVDERRVGLHLADALVTHLSSADAATLAGVLTAGLTFEELPAADGASLVRAMHHPHDFAVDPLPNLLFTRDSSVWVGDRVALTSLAMPARRRESTVLDLVYGHHPRFAGTPRAYAAHLAPLEGGDVLLLGDGVLAVGVGERTSPAGAESFARSLFADGLARAVLAVPIEQTRATMHLDTVCTMVDHDAVVMYPAVRETLSAYTLTPDDGPGGSGGAGGVRNGGVRISGPEPFLDAVAGVTGTRFRVVETGLDPVTAEREQWDDGNNTLALAPGVVVAYERNAVTNARLADAGVEVLAIAGSELGSGRGGPRCMSCPVARDALP